MTSLRKDSIISESRLSQGLSDSYISVTSDFKDMLIDVPKIMSNRENGNTIFHEFAVGEFIAHAYAYNANSEEKVSVAEREYKTTQINTDHKGLVAYILEPQEKNNNEILVVFRGTACLSSVGRDVVECKAPGHKSFESSKKSILDQIDKVIGSVKQKNNNPVIITIAGHSLGGADAQNCYVALMEEIDKHSSSDGQLVYTKEHNQNFSSIEKLKLKVYSSAGVLKETALKAKKLALRLNTKLILELYWLYAAGDGVQQTGEASILADVGNELASVYFVKGKHKNVRERELTSCVSNTASAHTGLYFLKMQNNYQINQTEITHYCVNEPNRKSECETIHKELSYKFKIIGSLQAILELPAQFAGTRPSRKSSISSTPFVLIQQEKTQFHQQEKSKSAATLPVPVVTAHVTTSSSTPIFPAVAVASTIMIPAVLPVIPAVVAHSKDNEKDQKPISLPATKIFPKIRSQSLTLPTSSHSKAQVQAPAPKKNKTTWNWNRILLSVVFGAGLLIGITLAIGSYGLIPLLISGIVGAMDGFLLSLVSGIGNKQSPKPEKISKPIHSSYSRVAPQLRSMTVTQKVISPIKSQLQTMFKVEPMNNTLHKNSTPPAPVSRKNGLR